MNYYNPNYYMNYPYNNQYPVANQQPQQLFTPTNNFSALPQQAPQGLNGKIVDSEDVVKATEVPIGGYGIFPKADLSEIYIKSWNNNGTTSIITFKPFVPEAPIAQPAPPEQTNEIEKVIQKIDALELKIDSLMSAKKPASAPINNMEGMKNVF